MADDSGSRGMAAKGIKIGGKLLGGVASIWGGRIAGELISGGLTDIAVEVAPATTDQAAPTPQARDLTVIPAAPKVDPTTGRGP